MAAIAVNKGGASSDLSGQVILQIIHAASHAQQPGGQSGVICAGCFAHAPDFRSDLREKMPEDGFASFAMFQLKTVQTQGKGYAISLQKRSTLHAHLIIIAFPDQALHFFSSISAPLAERQFLL